MIRSRWAGVAVGVVAVALGGCQGSGSSAAGGASAGEAGSVVGYSGGGSAAVQRLSAGMSEAELVAALGRPDEEVTGAGSTAAAAGSGAHRVFRYEGQGRLGKALLVTLVREGASWEVSEWSEE